MTNKEIKRKINQEFANEVPNVLNNILEKCEDKNMKKTNWFYKPLIAMASIILIALVGGGIYTRSTSLSNTTIEFDVNPSIEIKVNDNNKVVDFKHLNQDGKKILDNMNLKGSDLGVAVNAIIGSMYKYGYIDDIKNSILVSVNNKDKSKEKKIEKEVTDEINRILKTYNLDPAILSQEYNTNDNITKQANDNGISVGKALLINKILEANLTNKKGEKYTFNDLANLNINDLNVILNAKKTNLNNVTSSGVASTKKYIGYDKAKAIAFGDAKVNASNVRELEVEFDYDDGYMLYEVDFKVGSVEYEYDINALTGAIIKKDVEGMRNNTKPNNNTNYNSNSNTNYNNNTKPNATISRDRAKSIALANAGVSSGIRDLSIELDRENGILVYEVSFEVGNREYEYEINATTGAIINKKIEVD